MKVQRFNEWANQSEDEQKIFDFLKVFGFKCKRAKFDDFPYTLEKEMCFEIWGMSQFVNQLKGAFWNPVSSSEFTGAYYSSKERMMKDFNVLKGWFNGSYMDGPTLIHNGDRIASIDMDHILVDVKGEVINELVFQLSSDLNVASGDEVDGIIAQGNLM